MSDDTVRIVRDDAEGRACDTVGCNAAPVLYAHLRPAGFASIATDSYLCLDHLGDLVERARITLVAAGAIEPATDLERNVLAQIQEHGDDLIR